MKIKNAPNIDTDSILYEINNGGKIVYFQYSISIIVMTFKRTSGFYLLRNGENASQYHWPYTLISLLLGWWGIPWGFIYTPVVLFKNINGGNDITEIVVQELTGKTVEEKFIDQTVEIAALDKRIFAYIIDIIILVMFSIGATFLFSINNNISSKINVILPVSSLVYYVISAILESSKYKASLGKIILGLQVTTIDGNELSFAQAITRNIIKYISSLVLFLGHFFAFFNDQKQALHDKVINSIVVKTVINNEN